IRVLDTRKTLPGLRRLEKQAVVHGGGCNHRMGLYDMVLIKDNHIDAAGGITEAVHRVRERHGGRFPVEVETRSLEEVREAAGLGVDRIMLDNMSRRMMKRACAAVDGRAEIEASGNMTLRRTRRLRRLPLDYLSVGAITCAAGHADFSLQVGRGHGVRGTQEHGGAAGG
ncbi:MAG: nicotinate-nucleotide diphosphorylase (carboxylating), partial [Spirochaetota bacterium]